MKAEKVGFDRIKPNVVANLLSRFPKRGYCYRNIEGDMLALYKPGVSMAMFIPAIRIAASHCRARRVMISELPMEVVERLSL